MISVGELRELFIVDNETGNLSWRYRPSNSANADLSAGYLQKDSGYIKVTINGRLYPAHRLVYAITHGRWPNGQIDHINGDRSDNRPENLREVSSSENQKNCKLDRRNKSGVSGVRWRDDRQKWEASIRVDGKAFPLGRYEHISEAIAARKDAERRFGFHPNHGRRVA